MQRINETLKKIASATSKENSGSSANTESATSRLDFPGDPSCPLCGGIGYIRQDLPLDHPNFGRIQICSCRQQEVSQTAKNRLYALSNLEAYKNKTFETFNPGGRGGLSNSQVLSLTTAYNTAMHFAQERKGWLVLLGNYGCGKTHLAAAIANYAADLGVPTIFLTVPDLLDWLRFAYDDPQSSFEERFEEIRNISLLVLDDLGTQNVTPWAREKLFQIINYRYINQLPVVVTSNSKLEQLEERIRSRFLDPDLVTKVIINVLDYRHPTEDTLHPTLSSLQLHSGRTFGNFSLREHEKLAPEEQKSLEKAFHAAQQFAENPHGWLVLMGTYGLGKTHLAAAIGNYRAMQGEAPIFVVVPDLLDHLRATFSPSSSTSYDDEFNEIRSVYLLILDDLGTQSATPWAREKLYQLFNYRYNAELPTIITTSCTLDELDPRIRSRMLDERLCRVHKILVPPYRAAAPGGPKARRPRRSPAA